MKSPISKSALDVWTCSDVAVAKVPLLQDLRKTYSIENLRAAVCSLFRELNLDQAGIGTSSWNPLRQFIPEGSRVLLKPNWVSHKNLSGEGLECLITQVEVIEVVLEFVLKCNPSRVIIGDAPIQGCNLSELFSAQRIDDLINKYSGNKIIEWRDFRRTIIERKNSELEHTRESSKLENYVLFDLGENSLLEPISDDAHRFRVTMYNPDKMLYAHGKGRHQYLVAKEVLEADVIFNLPKLKTHKKSCVTGAIKNVVGINGSKDYLPHHRLGGSLSGGDNYEGVSFLKSLAERLLDQSNREVGHKSFFLRKLATLSNFAARVTGADGNIEGSWHGNDTVWRMCLDLNRILAYGDVSGKMNDIRQRTVISITDAIICGEGEGPLASTPKPLGVLTMAGNPVAAEFVHASLMGFDWEKIPIIREAFEQFKYPLTSFDPSSIHALYNGTRAKAPWKITDETSFKPPQGWKHHCELT
jgi:uncharacterized protein (DUF362 family)